MTANCLCGAISVTIEAKPDFIHDCNCSLCRKTGGAWGYFPTGLVTTTGTTTSYLRHDKPNAAAEVHACQTCSTATHWVFSEPFKAQHPEIDLMGVNMRLFDPGELKGVEVRFPNGDDWAGEGPFDYRRDAMTIGDTTPW